MAVDQITSTGLTIAALQDRINTLTTGMQSIYGPDINLDPSSPDGQLVNLIAEMVQDVAELIQQVNAMFDPDQAIGTILDQRVALNNIQRQGGTFTITNITVVTSQALNLPGLDQSTQPAFTVQDNAGTEWNLITSQIIGGAGTYVFQFQCANPGAIATIPNTITQPVTIILGITSVNNPTTYSTLGLNEETDAALKIRRQQSVALGSQGYLPGLLAALENISGITYAKVYENTTGSTNGDGVTGHSIWVVVAGAGSAAAIANAIYNYRNAGCGMVGAQMFNITQADGSIFTILWDLVSQVNLFTTFTLSSLDGVNVPKFSAVAAAVLALPCPPFGQVNINELSTLIQATDPNSLVTLSGFSQALSQIMTLSGVPASGTFVLNYNGNPTASINWNDSAATIQGKLRAVAGLGSCTVSGSLASQTLTINLAVTSALGLIYATSNSLQTVAPAAISLSFNESYQNSLFPPLKSNQFAIAAGRIVMLPVIMTSSVATTAISGGNVVVTASVAHGGNTISFGALGGYGTYAYAMVSGAGAINASTGVYTSAGAGTDVVKVTDAFGNSGQCTITVT